MAEGDAVADSGVRVWLDGRATKDDVGALKKWLERETPLAEMVRAGDLRIELRGRTDASRGHMGLGAEIILKLLDTSTTVALTVLLEHTVRAVGAWRANRERVEAGNQPECHVVRLNPNVPPRPDDPPGPVNPADSSGG